MDSVCQWDALEVMNARNCIQVDMPNAQLQVQTFEIFYWMKGARRLPFNGPGVQPTRPERK